MTAERKEAANAAIVTAISILTLITDEPDLRCALPSVPIFTHTMIAFSAAFLLQVAARWTNSNALTIDARHVLGHVTSVVSLLDEVKMNVGDNHLMRHIAQGLKKLLDNFRIIGDPSDVHSPATVQQHPTSSVRDEGINAFPQVPQPSVYNGGLGSFETTYNRENSNPQGDTWPWMVNDVRGTFGFGFDDQLLNPFLSDDNSWF